MATRRVVEVSTSPGLSDTVLVGHVQQASETLEAIIRGDGTPAGSHGDGIKAEWGPILDASGLLLRLRLSEGQDAVELVFRPAELTGDRCWYAMSRAYRALLRVSSRRLVDAVIAHSGGEVE